MKLRKKTAIITGGAGGIGAQTGRLFLEEGANVVLFDREGSSLARVAEGLDRERVELCEGDVSNPEDVERCFSIAARRFGGPDIVFANAGIEGRVCPLAEYPVTDFDQVMAVNVRGVWLTIRAAARAFQDQRGGAIIATSSVAGLVGAAGLSAYVASKHAVIGIVRSAALELAALGVRVNAINPGPIENRMMRSIEEQSSPAAPQEVKQGFEQRVALGRYGTNEEIARLALFLASEESSYCTGSVFVADGGFTAT
jgi:NAD(P)-dependent dehydrogenase (short-subunit alcohol dehydrogenase family)